MKTHTNIEQSETLAKILPLESADMYWFNRHIDLTENKYEAFVIDKSNKYIDFFKSYAVAINNKEIIPCWTLAALLNILPCPSLRETFGGWRCDCYNKEGTSYIIGKPLNNPIDTCVDMIFKLKEKNLL